MKRNTGLKWVNVKSEIWRQSVNKNITDRGYFPGTFLKIFEKKSP